ncbi:MAG: hypothetical protein OES34_06665 [Nitrosopumilus sp.]|nr:hypothetical protein [Nitrosopumilus sp.]
MSMSMGSTSSGAEVESVLRQIVESYLNGMEVSSSGGDSPKTNRVTFLPEVSGFGSIIDAAIQSAVIEHMEDNGGGDSQAAALPRDEQAAGTGAALSIGRGALSRFNNPASIVQEGLQFLPQAAIVAFAISIIPTIINELIRPGGPFDLRFKRRVEEEYNAIEERKYLYDINVGQKGLRFQTTAGFLSHNQSGALSANTQRMIRDGGINKNLQTQLDYIDYSEGLF